ncbi:MAG: formiminoglutamase [Cyclobacteriaceae bacterium]|jgi:formiminoglutamase
MDLKLFFDAIDERLVAEALPNDSLFNFIYINEHKMPQKEGLDIAIIGLNEIRGNDSISTSGTDLIRRKLYSLKRGSGSCNIADLGNLRNGPNLEETIVRIREVVFHLMEDNILPILIGGSHDLDYGQYLAYENQEKLVSILNVDSRFDLEDGEDMSPNSGHIHRIFTHEPNFLFNYNHLAHQGYLVNPSALKVMEQLSFQSFRLGDIREDLKRAEPLIREADMLTFDISAIKSQYCPGGSQSEVFGLSGEEACQICWYAGMNDKLSSAGFYEYDPDKDTEGQPTAMTMAVMIWYFIEGFKNRKSERGFQTNDFTKYIVSMESEPESIIFYKSQLSEKWWMEVPNSNQKGVYDRNFIVPCDLSDYEKATKGEVPERWISTIAKSGS